MMNIDVVNINEYSLLSPDFKIFISKFYNFKYKFDNHWKNGCPQGRLKWFKNFRFLSTGPVKKRPVKKRPIK